MPEERNHRLARAGFWAIVTGVLVVGTLGLFSAVTGSGVGPGMAEAAERSDVVAERLRTEVGGYSHWPACAFALGLPGEAASS